MPQNYLICVVDGDPHRAAEEEGPGGEGPHSQGSKLVSQVAAALEDKQRLIEEILNLPHHQVDLALAGVDQSQTQVWPDDGTKQDNSLENALVLSG